MDNKAPLRNVSRKVTFDVAETEVVTESKPPLPDASSPSKPQLTIVTSSIDSPSLKGATEGSGSAPLPSRDTSWAAWRVLCGAILVFGVLFGMSHSSLTIVKEFLDTSSHFVQPSLSHLASFRTSSPKIKSTSMPQSLYGLVCLALAYHT